MTTAMQRRLARLEQGKGVPFHLIVMQDGETIADAEARLDLPADGRPRVVLSAEDARL